VKGVWTYLYRAVDSLGQTIDFPLSGRRGAAAAKRFFRKALTQPHTVNPRTITVDKNPAYPRATTDMKRAGELSRSLPELSRFTCLARQESAFVTEPVVQGISAASGLQSFGHSPQAVE
jgi:transposase-like protein